MADQQLNVNITGDTSGLTKATADAARQLENLQGDIQEVDGQAIEVPLALQMDRVNRDLANLNRVLDGIERRKADPNVGLDIVQLRRDEARVRKAIAELEAEKVDIEVGLDVNNLSGISQALANIAAETDGGLSLLPGVLGRVGGAARGAAGAVGVAGAAAGGVTLVAALGAAGTAAALAAADVETLQLQLDALTGGRGIETLTFLQAWAKETPFELDQATEATKRLVAAGVPLEQIPGYLNDIGAASSAIGVPLGQIATVFAQMESKGRPAYEELQQLAEAGIPVWQLLADALGLTVAEVQQLATEGKLTADAITLLRQELAAKYPDALGDQAESLNGKLSSLRDTVTQTWQAFGENFMPAVEGAVDILGDLADIVQDTERIWSVAMDRMSEQPLARLVGDGWDNLSLSVEKTGDAVDWFADKVTGVDDDVAELGGTAERSMVTAADAIAQADEATEDLVKNLEAASDAFAGIGETARVRVDFIFTQGDLQEEVERQVGEGVTLPARLTWGNIDNLGDAQEDLFSTISSFAEAGLEEGARRAELNPGFDSEAWAARVRRGTRGLLVEAGVDPSNVERTLGLIFGKPREVKFKVSGVEAAQRQLAGIGISSVDATPRDWGITPKVVDEAAAKADLADLAEPRDAKFKPEVDPTSATATARRLDTLADDRWSTIYVQTVQVGGGRGRTGTDTETPGRTPRTTGDWSSSPVNPRQTPVKVYLDGAEIADRLELRTNRLATSTSTRRLA